MDLEDHLFFLCTQVVDRRDRALAEVLRPLGLLPTEWRVLGTLQARGPLTVLDLAQWTAFERTRLTKILHHMEARGWVRRTASDQDRRSIVVQLTARGIAKQARAERSVEALNERILDVVAPEDLADVRRALRAMRTLLIEIEQRG